MPTQFDALSQLFEQITERLIRIEAKLDTKADLALMAALEGRVRDLEISRAAKSPQIDEAFKGMIETKDRILAMELEWRERKAIEGFRLDTKAKKTAAAVAAVSVLASFANAVYHLVSGMS